jgi:hypothetical protein
LTSCYQQHQNQPHTNSNNPPSSRDVDDKSSVCSSSNAADHYLNPFSLELFNFELTGRGIRTNENRNEGDLLLEIPLEDTITTARVPSSLFDDHHGDDEEERLALGLLWFRDVQKSPYVTQVLPKKHYAIWTLPDELWQQIASSCLPRCYMESFQATRDRVSEFAQRVLGNKGHEQSEKQEQLQRIYSEGDLLWAFSMVRSRSVAVPELQPAFTIDSEDDLTSQQVPLALIPGLDLFNHGFGSATKLQLIDDKTSSRNDINKRQHVWVLSSSEAFQAGDQVFLSYGDEKDNWKLLLTYGFSVPNNPNSLVFWSWQDLLDAANKCRPAIFSERVCSQLMKHPQLQAYTIPSESRATFSYDAKQGEPRESLSNGLAMLLNLSTQLGHPSDNSLPMDVLDELKRCRLQELRDSQARLDAILRSMKEPNEWMPFMESLQVALKQEAFDLSSS